MGATPEALASEYNIPKASIVAKLASLGIYKRRPYLNKWGESPKKKSEYIERIAEILEVPKESISSLEKVNKNVLRLIEEELSEPMWKAAKP